MDLSQTKGEHSINISNRFTEKTLEFETGQAGKGISINYLVCQVCIHVNVSCKMRIFPIMEEEPLKNLDQRSITIGGKEIHYDTVARVPMGGRQTALGQ